MSIATNELERDVEASRSRLDSTLAKLQGRLNIPHIVEDALGAARHSDIGAGLYDRTLDAVRRNPVPVLLVCAGALLLLRQAKPAPRAYRDPDIATPRLAPTKTPLPSDP